MFGDCVAGEPRGRDPVSINANGAPDSAPSVVVARDSLADKAKSGIDRCNPFRVGRCFERSAKQNAGTIAADQCDAGKWNLVHQATQRCTQSERVTIRWKAECNNVPWQLRLH